jgi:integrase/recombinase XerD
MLNKAVESYLAIRRAAGFALRSDEYVLRSFSRFASARGDTHVITKTALEWASSAPSPAERGKRLRIVIALARHVRTEDQGHQIPPAGFFPSHRLRSVPFIFSQIEISRLIEHALRLGPTRSIRPHTFATLLALLSATGLRISEALALKLDDVTADGLMIRKTKFRKSRLVPLHKTVVEGLDRYLFRRLRLPTTDDHLLVSPQGSRLGYHTVRRVFLSLVKAAGIEPRSNQTAARIHSFRHTFAVRALESCPHDRDHIGQHMLALSTYMGHSEIADTYWYLEATPQLLCDICAASEAFVKGGIQ